MSNESRRPVQEDSQWEVQAIFKQSDGPGKRLRALLAAVLALAHVSRHLVRLAAALALFLAALVLLAVRILRGLNRRRFLLKLERWLIIAQAAPSAIRTVVARRRALVLEMLAGALRLRLAVTVAVAAVVALPDLAGRVAIARLWVTVLAAYVLRAVELGEAPVRVAHEQA